MAYQHVLSACVIALFAAGANLLLKYGASQPSWLGGQALPPINLYFFLGAGLFFTSLVIYMLMLREIPLYLAQSLIAFQYVSVMLASRFVLKESFSLTDIAGMVMICAGIFLVARGGRA